MKLQTSLKKSGKIFNVLFRGFIDFICSYFHLQKSERIFFNGSSKNVDLFPPGSMLYHWSSDSWAGFYPLRGIKGALRIGMENDLD